MTIIERISGCSVDNSVNEVYNDCGMVLVFRSTGNSVTTSGVGFVGLVTFFNVFGRGISVIGYCCWWWW